MAKFGEIQKGLHGKYLISKADGTELEPEAKYFVIRYDADATHGEIGQIVLGMYVRLISRIPCLQELAYDLENDISLEIRKNLLKKHQNLLKKHQQVVDNFNQMCDPK